ncbi:MAG TPA: regulatory protein RecX [Rubrivivax sp.]|nr:regulatory protein RecX [Rubrivivax sp.]
MKRPAPSLQSRALAWLAQREQSRSELRRKLLRVARLQLAADEAAYRAATPLTGALAASTPAEDPSARVDQLLDLLQTKGLLSEDRFVESRVRVRAATQGTRRIEMELAQHGLKLAPQALQQLRASELQRAMQLWQRRFGVPAEDDKGLARQMRFLAGRGFSAEVIWRVLTGTSALHID